MTARIRKYAVPVILALALFIAYRAWPRDHVLTSDARKLLNIKGWEASIYGIPATRYRWLSESRLLHTQGISDHDWTVSIYDADDRQDRNAAPDLTSLLRDCGDYPWLVSPDGQRILLEKGGEKTLHMLACVDMSGRVLNESEYEKPAGWLDSDSYLTWKLTEESGRATVHVTKYRAPSPPATTVRSPELAYAVMRNSPERQVAQLMSSSGNGKSPALPASLFHVGGGRLFAVETATIPMSLVVEQINAAKAERYPIDLPEGWEYEQHFVSPKGNYIAWILTAGPAPRYSTTMSRIFPWLKGEIPARTGLWVSDWQGKGMREVGHIYNREIDKKNPISLLASLNPEINQVEWLPGEHSVSFVHDDILYVVDVGL
jgi:hypothetical protein